MNPYVDAAVFESSPERIAAEGLGFDRCHVAVVTSIGAGLKLDFLEWDSPEKKSLVYRAAGDVVHPTGALVLKAGDELGALSWPSTVPQRWCYFRPTSRTRPCKNTARQGAKLSCARGQYHPGRRVARNRICHRWRGESLDVLLPAIAAAWALGTSADQITASLD